ncbi:MAG: EboA domain-containing protein [Granulosicoccaceae bacterium]
MNNTAQSLSPRNLLGKWLQARLPEDQWDWLQQKLAAIAKSNTDRELHIALGMAPRKLGKADLALSDTQINDAQNASAGWYPADWSIDGAARILMLLVVAEQNRDEFATTLRSLCSTADVSEAIVYYRGMALFPHSAALDDQLGEGLRTNMSAVFEAIAHYNPYPLKHFDDHRWNHMILKALFVDSRLYPIQGLDQRANPELAEILCHYAHERWAANRAVTPELWRCVGPHATAAMLTDLQRASQSNDSLEHKGAMLALAQSPLPAAAEYIAAFPDTAEAIADATLTWDALTDMLESTETQLTESTT